VAKDGQYEAGEHICRARVHCISLHVSRFYRHPVYGAIIVFRILFHSEGHFEKSFNKITLHLIDSGSFMTLILGGLEDLCSHTIRSKNVVLCPIPTWGEEVAV
jgi:hypothetical protein